MNAAKKHAVAIAIATASVLLGIYILRKAPVLSGVTGPLVDKALNG